MKTLDRFPTTRAEATCWEMNKAMDTTNMVTLVSEADAASMQRLRDRLSAACGTPPSYTALVIKAAALTMQRNPQANRAILGLPFLHRLYQFRNVDISVAIEKELPGLPGQAFAAPVCDTVHKSLDQITRELRALAECDEHSNPGYRTWMRILRYVPRPLSLWLINLPYAFPSLWVRYRGCAAWVNAPSRSGADLVMTTWPWPISFSFGIVKKRPVVIDDQVQARATMPLVMVFDRRIMGGGPAGRIFAQFKAILENAEVELADAGEPATSRPAAGPATMAAPKTVDVPTARVPEKLHQPA